MLTREGDVVIIRLLKFVIAILQISLLGNGHQREGGVSRQRHRLLDEDVHPGSERGTREQVVRYVRSRDDDGVRNRRRKQFVDVSKCERDRMIRSNAVCPRPVGITDDRNPRPSVSGSSGKMNARRPLPGADESDPDRVLTDHR